MQLTDPSPATSPMSPGEREGAQVDGRVDGRAIGRILAEVRAHLGALPTIVSLAATALACGVAGPFGTGTYLADGPRFLFWAVMATVTYAAGTLASEAAWQCAGRRLAALPGRLVAALGPALVTPPVVLSMNTLMLGTPYPFDGLAGFAASLFVVGGLVGLLVDLATRRPYGRPGVAVRAAGDGGRATPPGETEARRAPPRILARLPDHLRGPLVALSARDHYVRVWTTRGEGLVLMRLADAIAEADGTPGLRVHRSHWVARSRIRAIGRSRTGWVITMATGTDIPVSRAHVPALQAAGLLPRGRADG